MNFPFSPMMAANLYTPPNAGQSLLVIRPRSLPFGVPSSVTGMVEWSVSSFISGISSCIYLPDYENNGEYKLKLLGGKTNRSRSIKIAGDKFDEAIIKYIKKKYNVIIGERTAEDIKINIGCVYPKTVNETMNIKGRNLTSGLPVELEITSEEMMEALEECANLIVEGVHSVLEETPPELSADISDRGIYITGGGGLVSGLDQLLQERTGIPVMIAEDAISCVATGTGKALNHIDLLSTGNAIKIKKF